MLVATVQVRQLGASAALAPEQDGNRVGAKYPEVEKSVWEERGFWLWVDADLAAMLLCSDPLLGSR